MICVVDKDIETLTTALYVKIDDEHGGIRRFGRPPKLSAPAGAWPMQISLAHFARYSTRAIAPITAAEPSATIRQERLTPRKICAAAASGCCGTCRSPPASTPRGPAGPLRRRERGPVAVRRPLIAASRPPRGRRSMRPAVGRVPPRVARPALGSRRSRSDLFLSPCSERAGRERGPRCARRACPGPGPGADGETRPSAGARCE